MPAAAADSAMHFGLLAATAPDDLYIGGGVEKEGNFAPYLARWTIVGHDRLARLHNGTWEQWPLRDPWRSTSGLYTDASWRIWTSAA
ncbi:MAG TPA: hypothetical protein VHG93_03065 [Longimicrobium sp.]|nr:hypothetical protein [Longimicrobium sp.]